MDAAQPTEGWTEVPSTHFIETVEPEYAVQVLQPYCLSSLFDPDISLHRFKDLLKRGGNINAIMNGKTLVYAFAAPGRPHILWGLL
mmetsp:Transcript_104950/g.180983  ORF Transcript_104950/g.180983 Transcript_104950/m.180983 type:complete len:86 (-) Transcript_104950:9-266(-)